jgi:hypothetical protein
LLIAIQPQGRPRDSTLTVLEPPFAGSVTLVAFKDKKQSKAAAWSTVNVCPAIVIVPVRAL